VHGGIIMKIMDEAGAICAMRHARRPCVTVAIDSITFLSPVHPGELLCCTAEVTCVGKTSMEVEVRVAAENPMTGTATHTNGAYVVYVALDDSGSPHPVPPLVLETEAERQREQEARDRQQYRLAHR
jgi:acyl-CoA hydrolase